MAQSVVAQGSECAPPHIVDILIEERAARLRALPGVWPLVRTLLFPVLHYKQAVLMADAIRDLGGRESMRYLAELLGLDHRVSGVDSVPVAGGVVLAGNHPTGIADGVALFDALKARRPDLVTFANRDALRVSPGLAEVVIPVEWSRERRSRATSRATLRAMKSAFKDERAVLIFPSGRIAQRRGAGVADHPWQPTAVSLARRYDVPLVPFHISARASNLFYLFRHISDELRDITVFYELLEKMSTRMETTFGGRIAPADLVGDAAAVTDALQHYVEHQLLKGTAFRGVAEQAR